MVYSEMTIVIITMILSVIVAYHQNKKLIRNNSTGGYIDMILIIANTIIAIILTHILLPELSTEKLPLTIFTMNLVIPIDIAFVIFNLVIIFSSYLGKLDNIAPIAFISIIFISGWFIWYYIYEYPNLYSVMVFFYSQVTITTFYLIQKKDSETSSCHGGGSHA